MIVKDHNPQDTLRTIRIKIYKLLKLLNSNFISNNYSLIYLLVLYSVLMLPFLSILFKHHDYFPTPVSKRIYVCIQ